MLKLFTISLLGILLVSSASSYICIDGGSDNKTVQEFKIVINNLALKEDIQTNKLSPEAIQTKLKYFPPCIK